MLKAADEHSPEFGALLRVLAATGARRGEVCGLRWSDIDWAAGTVSIHRSVATVAGGIVIKHTKTHAARRIAVDSDTLAALARQCVRMEERARMCRLAFNEDGFVFTFGVDGSLPLHPDTITGGFRRLCEKIGLTGVRLHDLRHLHATQLLAAGVPVPRRPRSGQLLDDLPTVTGGGDAGERPASAIDTVNVSGVTPTVAASVSHRVFKSGTALPVL